MPKNLVIQLEDYCSQCNVFDPDIVTTELCLDNKKVITEHQLKCLYANVCEIWAGKTMEEEK